MQGTDGPIIGDLTAFKTGASVNCSPTNIDRSVDIGRELKGKFFFVDFIR